MLYVFQRASYSPSSFLEASRPPWFRAKCQQDCSEFLKFLLDQLHEQEMAKMKKARLAMAEQNQSPGPDDGTLPPSLIDRTFGGKITTTYRCLNCGYESSQSEMFTDIPLAFPNQTEQPTGMKTRNREKSLIGGDSKSIHKSKEAKGMDDKDTSKGAAGKEKDSKTKEVTAEKGESDSVSLEDMFNYYLEPEKLEGDNQYSCERCKGLQDGERVMKIVECPQYLIITLLRFAYNAKRRSRSKIFSDVLYPRTLNLPVCDSNCDDARKSSIKRSRTNTCFSDIKESKSCRKEKYCLCSMIVHSGMSSDCGHYYCYARHSISVNQDSMRPPADGAKTANVDYLQDRWYLFNDSRVTFSNFASFSNVTKRYNQDTAYVLVYKKIGGDTEAGQVDANATINPAAMDPTLRKDIRDAVQRDNKLFIQVLTY